MPRPKQTEEQIEAMRERILDATLELLTNKGPDSLSIRAIAKRVGVSHMVLYTYFKDRAELMSALRDRERARMRAWRAELLQKAETGDVCEAMAEALGSFVELAESHPGMYRFMWVSTGHKRFAKHRRRGERSLKHLAELVEMGIKRGCFAERDPFLAAATAFSMVNGPLFLYHSGRITDAELCDRMSEESLQAAMAYLCQQLREEETMHVEDEI